LHSRADSVGKSGFISAMTLSPTERERYSRHLLLPEIGEAGQLKLKAARVLVVGAGGLGSPASLYLAAAGVGTLGIADHDRVDAVRHVERGFGPEIELADRSDERLDERR